MLDGVGIGAEQEQLYRYIVSNPGRRLSELAKHWSQPAEEVEAVIRALVVAGLVTESDSGSDPLYTALAPDVAVPALVQARVDEARRAEAAVPALMASFWAGHRGDSHQFVDVVDDPETIVERWQQMQRATRVQVRALDCPPYFGNPLEPDPVELERLRDGVAYRVIYADAVLDTPGRWADIEAGINVGEQARLVPELPAKLTLFDDFAASLPINVHNDAPTGAAIVHPSPLLDCLSALFELYWSMAVPLVVGADGEPGPALGDVSPADTRLIRLLAAGLGDDAIRRALGVSASTVHRRIHDLMAKLGATTRFQAGLQIGRNMRV